jgi:hypothetical protein
MHFLFSLLRIKGLYMFRALLAHPQEALHKCHFVYCVRVMSVDCTRIGGTPTALVSFYWSVLFIKITLPNFNPSNFFSLGYLSEIMCLTWTLAQLTFWTERLTRHALSVCTETSQPLTELHHSTSTYLLTEWTQRNCLTLRTVLSCVQTC